MPKWTESCSLRVHTTQGLRAGANHTYIYVYIYISVHIYILLCMCNVYIYIIISVNHVDGLIESLDPIPKQIVMACRPS